MNVTLNSISSLQYFCQNFITWIESRGNISQVCNYINWPLHFKSIKSWKLRKDWKIVPKLRKLRRRDPIHDPRFNVGPEREKREVSCICLFDFSCKWHYWDCGKKFEQSLRVRWLYCTHVNVLMLVDFLWLCRRRSLF